MTLEPGERDRHSRRASPWRGGPAGAAVAAMARAHAAATTTATACAAAQIRLAWTLAQGTHVLGAEPLWFSRLLLAVVLQMGP